jgi:hypothetical protein
VLHLPADDPGLQRNFDRIVDKLPAGALHLRCSRMTVYSSKDAEGHTRQQMEARDKATVRWENEFEGNADVIKFDEAKQRVTLEALEGNYVVVKKYRVNPGEPNRVRAKTMSYNRLTGAWDMDKVFSISND